MDIIINPPEGSSALAVAAGQNDTHTVPQVGVFFCLSLARLDEFLTDAPLTSNPVSAPVYIIYI